MVGNSKIFIIFMPDWLIIVVLSLFLLFTLKLKTESPLCSTSKAGILFQLYSEIIFQCLPVLLQKSK